MPVANEAGTFAQARKLYPLKVGFLKIAGYANVHAALKENIFRDNGLDVTPVYFSSGSAIAAAAQGGAFGIALVQPISSENIAAP